MVNVSRRHHYEVTVAWTGNRGTGTSGYRDYGREHAVSTQGRAVILASSDPAFRGDDALWNPELELVAALSQCHMLSYLHVCATAGVVVTSYADPAIGAMAEDMDGAGRFTEVVLRPQVTVAAPEMIDLATELHKEAHAKCFIANSVNFPVRHEPVVCFGGWASATPPGGRARQDGGGPASLRGRVRDSRRERWLRARSLGLPDESLRAGAYWPPWPSPTAVAVGPR
jgi:organic hydroperoxide reductase OsmC/OhrA